MSHAWIIAASRTPLGKFLGELSSLTAPRMAAAAIRNLIAPSGFPSDQIDEVLLGQVVQAGVGQAPARQAALLAEIPAHVPATTINKVCGSGLKAIMLADQAIRAGDARAIVAGGMESMSQAPHLFLGSRQGLKFGAAAIQDALLHDGLTCASEHIAMGNIADITGREHEISRLDQDAFALASQQRAAAAQDAGAFENEISPLEVKVGKTSVRISRDENIRRDSSLEILQKLRPAFLPDGTVTAGNASQLADGAAAVFVAHEDLARGFETTIRARILATASTSRSPRELFLAPVDAIRLVLQRAGRSLEDIDLIELNEAFAVQCLACQRELRLPPEKLNVHGGAIALGHPIGASGARVVVTLLHALVRHNRQTGLAALCLGGGGAVAMVVERV